MIIDLPDLAEANVSTGKRWLDPGRYRGMFTEYEEKESSNGNPQLIFTGSVLEGPDQSKPVPQNNSSSPAGLKWTEYFTLTKKSLYRIKTAMAAMSIIRKDDTTTTQIDPDLMLNREIEFDVTAAMYTDSNGDSKEKREYEYIVR